MLTREWVRAKGGGDDGGARRRKGPRLIALATALLVAAGAGAALLFGGDEQRGREPAPTASPPVLQDPLDTEGAELVALLEEGRRRSYHATYAGAVGGGGETADQMTIEVWRDGTRLRQDSFVRAGDRTARTAGFLLGSREIICAKLDEAPWRCSEQDAEGVSPDGVFGSVTGQLRGKDVSASDATVGGRPARCFRLRTQDGRITICVSREGIPLRLGLGRTHLVLSSLELRAVEAAVFQPPARPGTGESGGFD